MYSPKDYPEEKQKKNNIFDINIYPNPVIDNLVIANIPYNMYDLIEIYDAAGRRVYASKRAFPWDDKAALDCSLPGTGTYMVKIRTDRYWCW